MDNALDPATNAALSRLQWAPLTRRGKHDWAFDSEVLTVVKQFERLREFLPNLVRVLFAVHKVLAGT
jgi:hypothetical protein